MYYRCQESYKGYSPWGGIQDSDVIMRGVKAVATAGHGGYMVTKNFANKYLSESALERGEVWSNYYCYEEDCAWAILFFDILHHHEDLFRKKFLFGEKSFEEKKQSLLETLSRYYADYLLELGVEPLEKQYKIYLLEQKSDEMRKQNHPDLIISALAIDKDTVEVITADDKKYLVTDSSYEEQRKDSCYCLLLSKCKVISK